MIKTFEEVVEQCRKSKGKRVLAVAAAADHEVLTAVIKARREGIAEAILVGNQKDIQSILVQCGEAPDAFPILEAEPGTEGQAAVDLVKEGKANVLMKGMLDTKALLGPVVKKENGLRTGGVMSMCAFFQLPGYHKLILETDGGMMIYPTLEEKKHIVENAVRALHALGYECPKVACLCGVEKVNPKMPETLDAAELKRMNDAGELPGCIVEGPISYDIAMSKEIAEHKGYQSPHCGGFDVLLVPNLAAGNLLGKCYSVTLGAGMSGFIMGAKVPIILTSRGGTMEERYYAIALASLAAERMGL